MVRNCRYEWFKDGRRLDVDVPLDGATFRRQAGTGTITVDPASSAALEGSYQCVASNQFGTAVSDLAVVRMAGECWAEFSQPQNLLVSDPNNPTTPIKKQSLRQGESGTPSNPNSNSLPASMSSAKTADAVKLRSEVVGCWAQGTRNYVINRVPVSRSRKGPCRRFWPID